MAVYFHIVELDDGRFACRHGTQDYDTHPILDEAREHIRVLATAERPASIFLHRRGRTAEHLEDV
jgi:hypothetical protein